MDALEDRVARQVAKHQEQNERLVEVLLHPLEAKLAAIERKQPALTRGSTSLGAP